MNDLRRRCPSAGRCPGSGRRGWQACPPRLTRINFQLTIEHQLPDLPTSGRRIPAATPLHTHRIPHPTTRSEGAEPPSQPRSHSALPMRGRLHIRARGQDCRCCPRIKYRQCQPWGAKGDDAENEKGWSGGQEARRKRRGVD